MKRRNVSKVLSITMALLLAIGGLGGAASVSALGPAASKPMVVPVAPALSDPSGDGSTTEQLVIKWDNLDADGAANTTETKTLTFTFDKEPTGLTTDHIIVAGAVKGELTNDQDPKIKKLSISNLTVAEGGSVEVTIDGLAGYTIDPKVRNIAVHREKLSNDAGLARVAGQEVVPTETTPGVPMVAGISVPYNKERIVKGDIEAQDGKATVEVFSDAGFSQSTEEILLSVGTPAHVYAKITAEDNSTTSYYDITVTRSAANVKLTKIAEIEFVPGIQSGLDESNAITGNITVPFSKKNIELKDILVTPPDNVTVNMYSDAAFGHAVQELSLEPGKPVTLYLKINTTADSIFFFYKVDVTQKEASTNAELSRIAGRILSYSSGKGELPTDPIRGSITVPYSKSQMTRNDIELGDGIGAKMIMSTNSNFEPGVESIWLYAGSYGTIYLKITAEDGVTDRYYAVTVRRTSASSDADLLYVAEKTIKSGNQKGSSSYPKLASITVNSKMNEISTSDLQPASGATAKLYKDDRFSKSVSDISLRMGDNTIYVIVTAEDGSTILHYEIDVARGSSSSGSKSGDARTQPAQVPGSSGSRSGSGFKDVENHWAQKSIEAMVSKGVFNGVDKNNFAPELTTNRAMMVTVLARLDKVYLVGFASPTFSDVPQGLWYSNSVEWAAEKKIVDGIGGGLFNPNGSVTREQMSVMLYNYMVFKGYRVPDGSGASAFGDEAKINSWSKDAVKAMQQAGIINGKPGNVFDPQGIATRAEVCTILDRFVKLYVN